MITMPRYLLRMDKLWTKRKAPTPLDWDILPTEGQSGTSGLEDQKVGLNVCWVEVWLVG